MKHGKSILFLSAAIVVISAVTTFFGIFSTGGPGAFEYESIRRQTVTIYGQGLYQHMSAEVAVQGIAQDYVTLCLGIPLLFIALYFASKNSFKGRFLLAGTLGYFFVTFLFYTCMAMFNFMFLGYVALLGLSFFALALTLLSFNLAELPSRFAPATPVKFVGGFLLFNTISIAFLWLSVILPPLLNGTIYPGQLEHYTTLIVQGLDLGLLLPLAIVSAILLLKRSNWGFLLAPVYIIFLALLMTALSAKIFAMAQVGANVIPVVFIIPIINLLAIFCAVLLVKNINEPGQSRKIWKT